MDKIENFEYQYADALKNIISNGVREHNRTCVDTIAIQHQYFRLPVGDNYCLPILHGKKVYPYMSLKECLWMLMGRTDVKWLDDHKVTYWDEWQLPDGTIGKSYGYQFRNFNGIDQLQYIVNEMTENPTSRRHIITLWNPSDMNEMALPPCQFEYHFCCVPKGDAWSVDMHVRMRSADSFLGVPYNFTFSAFFLTIICELCNIKNRVDNNLDLTTVVYVPGNIHMTCDDFHMYVNHRDAVSRYLMNVLENKENIIEKPEHIIIDRSRLTDKAGGVDDFLSLIEQDLDLPVSERAFKVQTTNVYGNIKADIAV